MNTDVDIVIVGGGAAGIGAARRLAQSNYTTLLLEAGPKLGGRADTHTTGALRFDLGCGWLHSAERNSWAGIAKAAGIPVDHSVAKWGVQYRDLGFPKKEHDEAGQAFSEWMQRLEHSRKNDCAADALEPGGEWNAFIRTIVGFISGARLEKLSIADYLAYDEASSDNNWRVPSGYGSLIAGSFPAQVPLHLSTSVESIAFDAQRVRVKTASGTLKARAAILTASTHVLAGESLRLPGELAPWREAASRLPLGCNEKVFLEIVGDSPFAEESQVIGNPRDTRTASYYIRPFGAPLIEGFFGGEGARFVAQSGAAAAFDFAIEQLSALFGAGIRSVLRPLATTEWSHTGRVGGAYSYALPGHAAARKSLSLPFDHRVFFAGEATSEGDFSTAHGAHDSGVRAAGEALASLASR